MTTTQITAEKATQSILRLTEAHPDRTNNGMCRYLTNYGSPNCIIAASLNEDFGVSRITLRSMDNVGDSTIDSEGVAHILALKGVEIHEDALEILVAAQRLADDDGNGNYAWMHVGEDLLDILSDGV